MLYFFNIVKRFWKGIVKEELIENVPKKWAVIWDMDGVIVDTAMLHFQAWQQLMAELNINLTYDSFLPTFGRKNADILNDLLGR